MFQILLTLYHTILTFTTLKKKAFGNIVGKGENAGFQHFRLFPEYFVPFKTQVSIFWSHLFCRLQMLSIWTSLKLLLGKELKDTCIILSFVSAHLSFCQMTKFRLFQTKSVCRPQFSI